MAGAGGQKEVGGGVKKEQGYTGEMAKRKQMRGKAEGRSAKNREKNFEFKK